MRLMYISVVTVLFLAIGVSSAQAKDNLTVSIARYRAGHYAPPVGNHIIVSDRPYPFHIVVRSDPKNGGRIAEKKGRINVAHLEFEFTSDKGVKSVVKHKQAPAASRRGGYRAMKPGESQVASVLLYQDSWDFPFTIPTDKDTEFTVRAIYVNKDKRIYSVPYKVTVKKLWVP